MGLVAWMGLDGIRCSAHPPIEYRSVILVFVPRSIFGRVPWRGGGGEGEGGISRYERRTLVNKRTAARRIAAPPQRYPWPPHPHTTTRLHHMRNYAILLCAAALVCSAARCCATALLSEEKWCRATLFRDLRMGLKRSGGWMLGGVGSGVAGWCGGVV